MRYDLGLIHELCQELGLRSRILPEERVEIELGEDCVLSFVNAEREADCLAGFEGTLWHAHGDFEFVGARGYHTEMNYLDVVTGLKDGVVLVCEQWREDRLLDRWLTHRDFNDEFKHMNAGEEIRVRRAVPSQPTGGDPAHQARGWEIPPNRGNHWELLHCHIGGICLRVRPGKSS
jgi:hypothetical protein